MDLDPSPGQYVISLIIAYFFSSYFSIVKIVFSSFDKNALASDQDGLRQYASKIEEIEKNRLLFGSVVSIGRTCSNIAFSIVSYLFVAQELTRLHPLRVVGITFGASALVLTLFAYFIPRVFARRYTIGFIPMTYRIYVICSWVLMPVASVMGLAHGGLLKLLGYDERFAFLSAEEMSRMKENTDEEESLDEEEKEMIHSIFELGETTVEEIMLPRVDIHAVEINTDLDKILEIVRDKGHSRLPVYRETIDSIVGVLYVKDVLGWLARHERSEWKLAALMKKPHFVPSQKKIDDLMREFKAKRRHLAIVVDEYGGTAGMVTMEDILEEIVGEIQDEYDNEETPVVQTGDGIFQVDPQIDLHDLGEELDVNLDVDDIDYNTLGGLIYHEHGDIPQPDTVIEFGGLRIKVLEMDNQRIQKVEVTVVTRKSPVDESF